MLLRWLLWEGITAAVPECVPGYINFLDLSADFEIFDNIENVTYYRRNLDGDLLATYLCVKALRRAYTGSLFDLGEGAQATMDQARWHLQTTSLPVIPRRGDRIESAVSGTWEILEQGHQTLRTRWSCECRFLEPPSSE